MGKALRAAVDAMTGSDGRVDVENFLDKPREYNFHCVRMDLGGEQRHAGRPGGSCLRDALSRGFVLQRGRSSPLRFTPPGS